MTTEIATKKIEIEKIEIALYSWTIDHILQWFQEKNDINKSR